MSALRWVGSKRRLAPLLVETLRPLLSAPGARLIEPFFGSGAGSAALRESGWRGEAIAGDSCAPLICFHRAAQLDFCAQIYAVAQEHEPPPLAPLTVRRTHYERACGDMGLLAGEARRWASDSAEFTDDETEAVMLAGAFWWLNWRCFNGLWRTNKAGEFNVAIGCGPRGSWTPLPGLDALTAHRDLLQRTALLCGDFAETISHARPGDVIYADPPYVGTFTGYGGGFGGAEQARLASLLREAHRRGVLVVASNSDTEYTRALYGWAKIQEVEIAYSVGGKKDRRNKSSEVLIVTQ